MTWRSGQTSAFRRAAVAAARTPARLAFGVSSASYTPDCQPGRLASRRVTQGGKPVATRESGDFVGEIGLITHSKRTATVTAATPVRCFVLTSGEFRRVLDDNPGIQRKVMQALAERVARLESAAQ